MESLLASFFETTLESCGPIYNERSLQLELACLFRAHGAQVEFESLKDRLSFRRSKAPLVL